VALCGVSSSEKAAQKVSSVVAGDPKDQRLSAGDQRFGSKKIAVISH
jgi:hypothetical protein